MKEKWIRINTIEGLGNIKDYYWISNADEDKIMNRDTGIQLKPCINSNGYKMVRLRTIDRKYKLCNIHMLKTKAFLFGPNPLGYNVIRHLNDVKTDNRLENLAWGTISDNTKDSIRNGSYSYEGAIKGGKIGGVKNSKIGNAMAAKKTSKPVKCIEMGIVYPSALQAEHELNLPRGGVSHCCLGKCKTSKGLHFEFVNKEEVK